MVQKHWMELSYLYQVDTTPVTCRKGIHLLHAPLSKILFWETLFNTEDDQLET